MRLFTAVNFSEKEKKARNAVQDGLHCNVADGRFTSFDNLHLTLVFLGETAPGRVTSVKRCIESIHFNPFTLYFSHIGSFNRSGGSILWLGADPSEELMRIQSELSSLLDRTGFPVEERRFVPHLTLAREVVIRSPLSDTIPQIKADVNKISLMKSERIGGKLIYSEL